MRGMIRRMAGTAALGSALVFLFAASQAHGSTILVKPGKLDHFVITAPPTAVAGEGFMVRIEPYDASNNLITEFRGKSGVFTINVSGGGEVAPARLRAEEFAGGAAVKVADKRAELLEVTVTEGDAATPIAAVQVRILPNRLDRFVVNTPREVTAGETFQARVIAQDAFGNTKTDLAEIRENLRLEFSGAATVLLADKTLPPFRGGETILSFQPRKAGKIKIAVQEIKTRSQGESPTLQVNPARLDHFTILGPKAAVAGEKFIVLVSAFDAFENLVTNYQSQGEGVAFLASGTGALAPSSVPAREFQNGQARVTFTYTRAEPLRISAREVNREVAGQSEPIAITPADPDHFRVTTPAEAVAGEGFPAQIEALDRFSNLIEDYDLRGLEVLLSTDGKGQLIPAAVSPSAFVKGKATVSLVYNRAESFTVVAALSREAIDKLLAERKRQAAAPPQPELSAEEVAREQERAAAAQAREEAQKAKEEAEKKRSREEAVKAREEAERARAARKTAVAPEKPAAPSKPSPTTKPIVADSSAAAKPAKPAPLQAAKPFVKNLEAVQLEEGPDQAVIRFATSGPVSYNASTGSALSKEWIWIELFPARRGPGVGERVPVESHFLGQIIVEQVEPEKVKIALQVLPQGISYVVSQQDRAVVVKIVKTE